MSRSGSIKTATFSDMISTKTIAKLNALSRGQDSKQASLSKSSLKKVSKSESSDSDASSSEEDSNDDTDLISRAKKARALKRKREADDAAEAKAKKKAKTSKESKTPKNVKENKAVGKSTKETSTTDSKSIKKTRKTSKKAKDKGKDGAENVKVKKPKKLKEEPAPRKKEDLIHSQKTCKDVQEKMLKSKEGTTCKTVFTLDSEYKDVQVHAQSILKRQTWKSKWPLDLSANSWSFPWKKKIVLQLYFEIPKEFNLSDKDTQADLNTIAVMFARYIGNSALEFTMPGIGVIFFQDGWAWTETLERLFNN